MRHWVAAETLQADASSEAARSRSDRVRSTVRSPRSGHAVSRQAHARHGFARSASQTCGRARQKGRPARVRAAGQQLRAIEATRSSQLAADHSVVQPEFALTISRDPIRPDDVLACHATADDFSRRVHGSTDAWRDGSRVAGPHLHRLPHRQARLMHSRPEIEDRPRLLPDRVAPRAASLSDESSSQPVIWRWMPASRRSQFRSPRLRAACGSIGLRAAARRRFCADRPAGSAASTPSRHANRCRRLAHTRPVLARLER